VTIYIHDGTRSKRSANSRLAVEKNRKRLDTNLASDVRGQTPLTHMENYKGGHAHDDNDRDENECAGAQYLNSQPYDNVEN